MLELLEKLVLSLQSYLRAFLLAEGLGPLCMQEWIPVCGHALDYGFFYKLEEKLGTDYSAL